MKQFPIVTGMTLYRARMRKNCLVIEKGFVAARTDLLFSVTLDAERTAFYPIADSHYATRTEGTADTESSGVERCLTHSPGQWRPSVKEAAKNCLESLKIVPLPLLRAVKLFTEAETETPGLELPAMGTPVC